MKLINYALENEIVFDGCNSFVLVIEDAASFQGLTNQMHAQCNGDDGDWILHNGKDASFTKSVSFISDYFSLNLNDRKIIARITEQLRVIAFNENNADDTHSILSALDFYLQRLAAETEYPVAISNIDISSLLKATEIGIVCEARDLLGKLADYATLLSGLTSTKLMIFVNLKSFLPNDKLEEFYLHCAHCDMKLLLFESCEREKLQGEVVLISDKDKCEFFI